MTVFAYRLDRIVKTDHFQFIGSAEFVMMDELKRTDIAELMKTNNLQFTDLVRFVKLDY